MENIEILIPVLSIVIGAVSSFLISVAKVIIKKYTDCKEVERNLAILITVLVCMATTYVLMGLFETEGITSFLTTFVSLFLMIYGSSQLTYKTNLNKIIEN